MRDQNTCNHDIKNQIDVTAQHPATLQPLQMLNKDRSCLDCSSSSCSTDSAPFCLSILSSFFYFLSLKHALCDIFVSRKWFYMPAFQSNTNKAPISSKMWKKWTRCPNANSPCDGCINKFDHISDVFNVFNVFKVFKWVTQGMGSNRMGYFVTSMSWLVVATGAQECKCEGDLDFQAVFYIMTLLLSIGIFIGAVAIVSYRIKTVQRMQIPVQDQVRRSSSIGGGRTLGSNQEIRGWLQENARILNELRTEMETLQVMSDSQKDSHDKQLHISSEVISNLAKDITALEERVHVLQKAQYQE